MIILDTNVISEAMRPNGHPAIRRWLDQQVAETLYLTAISLAELLVGLEVLPDGKRKSGLAGALTELIERLFESRILPFDPAAARVFAPLVSRARAAGKAIGFADAQIAAIASVHEFLVATRDVDAFAAAGVRIINPWQTAG